MSQLPLFTPTSSWKVPSDLPDLTGQTVALDTETKDDALNNRMGSGWAYQGRGHICGVSVAWGSSALYAPVAHPDTDCLDRQRVQTWVSHILRSCTVVMQSAPYDIGWMMTDWGLPAPLDFHDTILMAVMLDENCLSYNLNAVCASLNIPGKDETALREAATSFGLDPKKELWKLPARFVGPYAEQDARCTLAAYQQMLPMLKAQDLMDAYLLDRDLIPMVIKMRRRGIRVDMDRADQVKNQCYANRNRILSEISRRIPMGRQFTINDLQSPLFLERLFDIESIPYPRTPKSKRGSFQDEWMKDHSHWLPRLIAMASQQQELASKFLEGFIIKYAHRGRLHAEIHSFRSDEGGTRSHRFSYSDPPLQQMPSRWDWGREATRSCFLPEPGELWLDCDYSQQEYRLIVHYAALLGQPRAQEAVEQYRQDPTTDFHRLVADWTGLDRKRAKDTNFAKAFGAGIRKFASMIRKPESEAKSIYEQYDRELPFVSGAASRTKTIADKRGYIRLIDGARSRFDMWEPSWREQGEAWSPPRHRKVAEGEWPGRKLRRAFTHKAFNRLIQGSAARQTKLAMRECWKDGLVPLLQMHDALGFSIFHEATQFRVQEIMRDVVTLEVPVCTDAKVGLSWGTVKKRSSGILTRWARLPRDRSPASGVPELGAPVEPEFAKAVSGLANAVAAPPVPGAIPEPERM